MFKRLKISCIYFVSPGFFKALRLTLFLAALQFSVQTAYSAEVRILSSDLAAAAARAQLLKNPAGHTFRISTYHFEADDLGFLTANLLIDSAHQGAKVKFLVDGACLIRKPKTRELLMVMQREGVDVRVFNPIQIFTDLISNGVSGTLEKTNFRLHEKLFLKDQTNLILGSRNITAQHFSRALPGYSQSPIPFLDREIQVTETHSPTSIREAVIHFDKLFENSNWSHTLLIPTQWHPPISLRDDLRRTTRLKDAFEKLITYKFKSPWINVRDPAIRFLVDSSQNAHPKKVFNILKHVIHLIDESHSTIWIENAYVILTPEIREALERAKKRGVRVEIATSHPEQSHQGLASYVLSKELNALQTAVDHIHLRKGRRYVHSKVMVVDGQHSIIGSFNLDPRSAYINLETALMIQSEEFAQRLEEESRHSFRDSRRGRNPILDFRGWVNRIKTRTIYPLLHKWRHLL